MLFREYYTESIFGYFSCRLSAKSFRPEFRPVATVYLFLPELLKTNDDSLLDYN